ncbi:unnamed protein product [Staurois parvus]|uniref:GOLD domain-containing protein n=1 Tax=Staurois parvus TaxID=386267 RepID=A0ABN9D0A7_9NEOB|nr:unnamed protein product [Staurois parvus]
MLYCLRRASQWGPHVSLLRYSEQWVTLLAFYIILFYQCRVETVEGDYQFCFYNTFSRLSEKVIFFELILDHMNEEGNNQEDWKNYAVGADLLDMKLEDILETINSVKARLGKSLQLQTLLKAFEARDRNTQESNNDRVNFWSIVNLLVMVVVSVIQVYLLKSLFEDKRKSRP